MSRSKKHKIINSIGSEVKRTEWKLKKNAALLRVFKTFNSRPRGVLYSHCSAIHADYTELPNPTERNVVNGMKFNTSNIMYPVLKLNDKLLRAGGVRFPS